jgi:ribose 1,5-bisphosphokinase
MNVPPPSLAIAGAGLIGPGRFILVVGPSGAGKDTVINHARTLCAHDPDIVFVRRVVTRPRSIAEDHDSLDNASFDSAVDNGMFAFWWRAHGLKYGIPRTADLDIRTGRTLVCNVSRGIVADVRNGYAHVDAVLITAPAAVLSARLSNRSRDTDGNLTARLQRSDSYADFKADYVIENIGTPDVAARQLLGVIRRRIGANSA